MTLLATYSPEDVNIVIASALTVSGFVDGTFVSISKDFQTFTTSESSDGVPTRSHSNSQLYTLTLTLASTSVSNQPLTYLHRLDEITMMGKFPLIVKDTRGGTLFFSSSSWIEGVPDTDFSTNIDSRQWTIKCANAVLNIGGNEDETGVIQDIINIGGGLLGNLIL